MHPFYCLHTKKGEKFTVFVVCGSDPCFPHTLMLESNKVAGVHVVSLLSLVICLVFIVSNEIIVVKFFYCHLCTVLVHLPEVQLHIMLYKAKDELIYYVRSKLL